MLFVKCGREWRLVRTIAYMKNWKYGFTYFRFNENISSLYKKNFETYFQLLPYKGKSPDHEFKIVCPD